jgi:uncharacterized membrane protein
VATTTTQASRLPSQEGHSPAPAFPKAPGLLLGMGLGGFIDGIVLHQVLQWHHLLTGTGDNPMTTVRGLEDNTFADGLFHLSTWLLVAAGMALAVSAWQQGKLAPPWGGHIGMMLVGWGVFNVAEGIVDHQILQIHHVRDDLGGPLSWDLGFIAFGGLLVGIGWGLAKAADGRMRAASSEGPDPARRPGRGPAAMPRR